MMGKIKRLLKKIFKICHINVHTPVLGVYKKNAEYFFEKLNKLSLDYVILRWYDYLPYAEPGEDFDILVSNESCKKLVRLLKRGNVLNDNFIKCDVYPKNNTKGFLAYYPPELAQRCLDNKVNKNGVWILNDETYFYSLVYHALFHKGYNSGIKSRFREISVSTKLEHDYSSILAEMADKIGIDTRDYSLEDYVELLEKNNWLPPLDVFFRRSKRNPWIHDYLQATLPNVWFERRGVVCFVVREKGDNQEIINHFKKVLEKHNASILEEIVLSKEERIKFAKLTRGGDWGKGPAKVGGGLPSRVFIVKKKMEEKKDNLPYGVVEYQWVKEIKVLVREHYNKNVSSKQASNILHSTDNGVEASYYIDVLEKITGRMIDGAKI